jgi:hypothetical protein
MKLKKLIIAALTLSIPLTANAADNVGGCGWGSKLFDGQKGIAPQVLAVTTNGTSGNQTFGISSGTSGCTQDGTVVSKWKTAAFIDSNMNRLALDISRGQGESLESLAAITGVASEDSAKFNSVLQQNFASIFSSPSVTSNEVAESLRNILASDITLSRYASNV